jgi:Flp pilus assembly protein CpaB
MTAIRKLTSTREGTLALAIGAAIIAALTLLIFMNGYKRTLDKNAQPVTVLVAKQPLPKGSSGDVIARKGLFQATGFKRDQVKDGAITDPGSLSGVVAVHDIVRGAQLTTADFAKPTDPVLSRLGPDDRAISIPLDSAHGMIGRIQAGDHVDVLAGFEVQPDGATRPRPVVRTLLQDVTVLQAPPVVSTTTQPATATNSAQTQNVVLKVPERQSTELAFSSDNGKVWVVLRPQVGATQRRMSLVTLDRLLLGMDPIPVDRFLAKKRGLINKVYKGDF